MVTLGLVTSVKWDKARWGKPSDYVPTPDDLSKADDCTDREFAAMRETALSLLAAYTDPSVSRRQWWSGVWQNMVGSFFWALFLFAMGALALHLSGGDVGAVLRDILKERPAAQAGAPQTGVGQLQAR